MKILIYGAGVIGTLYAALLSEAGYNIALYARGARLESLEKQGLLYSQRGRMKQADVNIIGKIEKKAFYDFIFLPVRENQVHKALNELCDNISPNIVTMVNTLEPYNSWEAICGKGRIIPAFPGAGGYFDGAVLNAALAPRILQPTTFGEISGRKTKRLAQLAAVFKRARIPYQIVKDMHVWQLCHLAMVVPIADAYYETEIPEQAGADKKSMLRTARQMKANFSSLADMGIKLSPPKMNLFRFIPIPICSIALSVLFQSEFGNAFMYRHSMKAPDEMRALHEQFYGYIEKNPLCCPKCKRKRLTNREAYAPEKPFPVCAECTGKRRGLF